MQAIIVKSIQNSYSYPEYRTFVTALLKEGKSTGHEQSDVLTHYSELNEVRMNRLDKTLEVAPEVAAYLKNTSQHYIWLVLAEGWCGDAAQLLPIMNKMAQQSDSIDLRIVLRDDTEALMNQFLTNGAKAIPKLIVVQSDTLEVLADWGPRPQGAAQVIKNYKAQYGIVDGTAKSELQKWYLKDKGMSTQAEITAVMKTCEITLVNRLSVSQ